MPSPTSGVPCYERVNGSTSLNRVIGRNPVRSSSHFTPWIGASVFGVIAIANSRRSEGEAWPLV